jgi:hypothetical protein
VSYRKREVALLASPERVVAACKRAAAVAGLRLVRETPKLLYFREPFSFRRLRRLKTRLELTVQLEPRATKTHAVVECERLGALQSVYVELDLVRFLDRLVSRVGRTYDATRLGPRWFDSRRGLPRVHATRLRRLRTGGLCLLAVGLLLIVLGVGARLGGAAAAAKALAVAGLWLAWVPPRALEMLRLRGIGASIRRDLIGLWLPLLVGGLLTWLVLTR